MANPNENKTPNEEKPKTGFKEKFNETLENLKKNEKIEDIVHYASSNTRDSIAYVFLAFALILMLFIPLWGGILIGLVGGVYFSDELVAFFKEINNFIENQGFNRTIVIGAIALGIFLLAYPIFIGAAIAVGIKQMLASS